MEHEAHKDFVDILTKYSSQLPKCAIVDFTGTTEELEKYVEMGFYIAITGLCFNVYIFCFNSITVNIFI